MKRIVASGLAIGLLGLGVLWAGRGSSPSSPKGDSNVAIEWSMAVGHAPVGSTGLDANIAQSRTADAAHGASLFGQCAACHSIGRDGPDLDGPNLYGVVGAPVARRRSRFAYTAALRHVGGSWDADTLDLWLSNPRKFVPGTSMSFAGLPDPRERVDVIAYLTAQGSNQPPDEQRSSDGKRTRP